MEAVGFSGQLPLAASASLDGKLMIWDCGTLSQRGACEHPSVSAGCRWGPEACASNWPCVKRSSGHGPRWIALLTDPLLNVTQPCSGRSCAHLAYSALPHIFTASYCKQLCYCLPHTGPPSQSTGRIMALSL